MQFSVDFGDLDSDDLVTESDFRAAAMKVLPKAIRSIARAAVEPIWSTMSASEKARHLQKFKLGMRPQAEEVLVKELIQELKKRKKDIDAGV